MLCSLLFNKILREFNLSFIKNNKMSAVSTYLSQKTKSKLQTPLSQFSYQHLSQPTNDSQVVSSNYARYLSYLSFEDEQQNEDEHKLYWQITYKSILYLKRQPLNTHENDEIIGYTFAHHFDLSKLDPKPTDQVGRKLIKNGYFLAAYALLLIRLKDSPVYLKYFREVFSLYEINIGFCQLSHFLGVQKKYDSKSQRTNDRRTEEKPVKRSRLQLQQELGYGVKTFN